MLHIQKNKYKMKKDFKNTKVFEEICTSYDFIDKINSQLEVYHMKLYKYIYKCF